VFELTEEMLSEDVTVWDFWGVLGDDETEVDFRIAGDDGPFDTVTEAIAGGGTCDLGGGETGVPVCLVISPTDAGPDDEITVTAYDEEGVKVDLSEWTGGVEMNFAGSGEEGFMIFPGDDEMVDGSVVIVLGEGRFNHNQWDFFTWIPGTDLNAWLPVAMPGFGEGAIFDYVPDAIAAGGTCEGTLCVSPPAADIDGDCRVGMYELMALADAWLDPKDLSDLADLANNWLDCGLDPPEACW